MFCAKRFWMSSLLHACIKWSGFGIKNDCESVLYWMGSGHSAAAANSLNSGRDGVTMKKRLPPLSGGGKSSAKSK